MVCTQIFQRCAANTCPITRGCLFSIDYSRTNLRRQCTSNVGKRLSNNLPVDLNNISSIYLFKKKMKFCFFAMLLSCGDMGYCAN